MIDKNEDVCMQKNIEGGVIRDVITKNKVLFDELKKRKFSSESEQNPDNLEKKKEVNEKSKQEVVISPKSMISQNSKPESDPVLDTQPI